MKILGKIFILGLLIINMSYGEDGDGNQNKAPTIAPNPAPDDPRALTSPQTTKDYLRFGMDAAKKQDYKSAFKYFKQACDNGDPAGCFAIGTMYANGVGILTNLDKAERYYEMGCSGGDATACSSLATIYDSKDQASVSDKKKAVELYMTACQGGDVIACNNLAYMYANGLSGAPVSYHYAARYFNQACLAGDIPSCNNLAVLYQKGLGVPQDTQRALDLYSYACNSGHQKACDNYRIYKQQLIGGRRPDHGALFFPNNPNLGKKPPLGKDPMRYDRRYNR